MTLTKDQIESVRKAMVVDLEVEVGPIEKLIAGLQALAKCYPRSDAAKVLVYAAEDLEKSQ